MGLSVAYEGVREHLRCLYAELAGFGADGVCANFIRGCPAVLYEPPMVEGFRAECGEDPRHLPENDEQWRDYCARVVTSFMRELKEAVGPGCKLGAIVHGTRELNRRFALDVATWVAEGVVSDLFIMGHTYDEADCHGDGGPEDLDYEGFFQQLPGRENVRLWPMFYLWQRFDADREGFCAFLQKCLEAGADGYGFWDAASFSREKRGNVWDLGKASRPSYERRGGLLARHPIRCIDGHRHDRYTSIECM